MIRSIVLFCILICATAQAMDPFEIQVYTDDINEPGKSGLEMHVNYVAKGNKTPGLAGFSNDHSTRTTLEFSRGITESFDVGLYYQTVFKDDQGYYAGTKLRAKYLPKHEGKAFWGINIEVGRSPQLFETVEWGTELRPILGINGDNLLLSFNPIFDWGLGQGHSVPEFEPQIKLGFKTKKNWLVGIEYYAGLGEVDKIPKISEQEHSAFLVFDNEYKGGELNIGVGRGLTSSANDWIVKTIIGFEL